MTAPEDQDQTSLAQDLTDSADSAVPTVQPQMSSSVAMKPSTSRKSPKSILDPDVDDKEPEEKENLARNSTIWIYIVGIIISLAVITATGAIVFIRSRQPVTKSQEVASEVSEKTEDGTLPEDEVIKNEVNQLVRKEIRLEILNGSGISGIAGKSAKDFEELGYESIDTGNAEATVGNHLYVNPKFTGVIDVLLDDVEEEFGISSVSGDLKDSDATARIILGS